MRLYVYKAHLTIPDLKPVHAYTTFWLGNYKKASIYAVTLFDVVFGVVLHSDGTARGVGDNCIWMIAGGCTFKNIVFEIRFFSFQNHPV